MISKLGLIVVLLLLQIKLITEELGVLLGKLFMRYNNKGIKKGKDVVVLPYLPCMNS